MAKTKVREVLQSDESTKEKIDYLWGYYKFHVIMSFIAFFLVGYLIVDWVNRPITYFHMTVMAPEVMVEEEKQLSDELYEILDPQGNNEAVYASFLPHGPSLERFSAQYTDAEYDLILMDSSSFDQYAEYDIMQEFNVAGLSDDDYYRSDSSSGQIGIDAAHFPLFNTYTTTENKIVVIPENSTRPDAIQQFFNEQGLELELIEN